MSRKKTVILKIDQIQETFCVRKDFSEDRALMFWQILEDGSSFDPIEVTTDTYELIDGRHRLHALREAERSQVECVLVEQRARHELIAMAAIANSNAPLPMTSVDIITTMKLLIEEGLIRKQAVDLLRSTRYPGRMLRGYYDEAKKQINEQQLRKAANSVAEGNLTVPDAAEKHGIEVEKLRQFLSGKRRKAKTGLAEMKSGLSSQFKSHSHKVSNALSQAIEKFQDGEMTVKQVREFFDQIERLVKKSLATCMNRRNRFETTVKGDK